MGKTRRPLKIAIVGNPPSEVVNELVQSGHEVSILSHMDYDLIVGKPCWHVPDIDPILLRVAVTAMQTKIYSKGKKSGGD